MIRKIVTNIVSEISIGIFNIVGVVVVKIDRVRDIIALVRYSDEGHDK